MGTSRTPAGHRPSPKIVVTGSPRFGSDRRRTGHAVGTLNSALMTRSGLAARKDDAAQQGPDLAERRLRGIERDRIDFAKA
jgi:hypothetical protein